MQTENFTKDFKEQKDTEPRVKQGEISLIPLSAKLSLAQRFPSWGCRMGEFPALGRFWEGSSTLPPWLGEKHRQPIQTVFREIIAAANCQIMIIKHLEVC